MASIQRMDMTNLSSPDGGLHNVGGPSHRSFGASLDKSHNIRDSHDGRASSGGGGPSSSHGELLPLTSILFLDVINLTDAKSTRQVELRRAMNAASGQQSDDPSLGSSQLKALENYSSDEIKRVRSTLSDNVVRARERARQLSEAMIKLDRYQMQSRKRSKADSGVHDRASHQGPGQRGTASGQGKKGAGRGVSSSGEASGALKGGDKCKSGMINKRIRTSLADARPEGRPSNLSVQRSSGVQERDRDSPRLSSFLNSPVEEKERVSVGFSEGWEKTKMKGRRSATIKAEASVVISANVGADGERERKGNALHQRAGGDTRSRPSEGHGFRSGPVHGVISVQKSESGMLANGSRIRGACKIETEVPSHLVGKADRSGLTERERLNGKLGAKPISREERHAASPGITPKAKGARAPRSNLVAGGNQTGHMGRSSSFTEVREKPSAVTPPKPHVSSGPVNRKRPAPSRSSSPPVASWGSSRPQKMARARRANLTPPVSIFVSAKEEANGVGPTGTPLRDGIVSAVTPGMRLNPSITGGGPNLAKRLSSGHVVPPSKAQAERLFVSVGPGESDDCVVDGHKSKQKSWKHEDDEDEYNATGANQKFFSVITKNSVGLAQEESGGGDGVRRQGRTGRGSVIPRVVAANSPPGKVDVSPVISKPTRSARATVESKLAGPGRPSTKKGTSERKGASRQRRFFGNSVAELSGEEDDDHEQLLKAVQLAVEFSATACPNSFWLQLESYFGYVTPDDLSFLHQLMSTVGESNTAAKWQSLGTAAKSPTAGERVLESDEARNLNNFTEQSMKESSFRSWGSGGGCDKVFALSQRLISAFISEREDTDEASVDRDSDSSLLPSSYTELDYDRRDAEGESDVDNAKGESDWWSGGTRVGGYCESSPMSGGQRTHRWGEDQDGDDVVVDNDGRQSGRAGWVNGVEGHVRENQEDAGSQIGNGLMDWEQQYQRMSLDDRLFLELRSIGLLPVQLDAHNEQDEDDISEELLRLQNQLAEQVSSNKEHLYRLENAVSESRAAEERAREKLAMDRFVELAYKKKTGGRSTKGAAAKGAKLLALAFAKRALARVTFFENGHQFVTDSAVRDRLFCVPPSLVESTPDAAMDAVKEAGAVATTAERIASPKSAGGAVLTEVSVDQRMGGERASFDGHSLAMDCSYLKEEARERDREREIFLEDVSGYTSTRDVNTLSSNGFGGIKGKRSERERDGKVKEGCASARSGQGNVKGERKNKTKPRQKTGSLLKSIQGLAPKAADHHSGKGRSSNQAHISTERHLTRRDEVMPSLPVVLEPQLEADAQIDLSAIPLPVDMDDMSMAQADMGSWLQDFDLEDPLQQTDDFLDMGLDIPMDDLSGLNMMM